MWWFAEDLGFEKLEVFVSGYTSSPQVVFDDKHRHCFVLRNNDRSNSSRFLINEVVAPGAGVFPTVQFKYLNQVAVMDRSYLHIT